MKPNKEVIYLNYLKEKVYPDLHTALIQLIDHVVKTEEVRKHQERLKKIKIYDKLEQKRTEKERIKAELGSLYESSEDESMDWDELGIDKEEIERLMKKEKETDRQIENSENPDQQELEIDGLAKTQRDDLKGKPSLESLVQIQENEEPVDNDPTNEEKELQKMKEFLKKQREESLFNPLLYLAKLLRDTQVSK